VAKAVRAHIDGKPLKTEQYDFPTVYDGLRGMQFIYKAVESCDKGSSWIKCHEHRYRNTRSQFRPGEVDVPRIDVPKPLNNAQIRDYVENGYVVIPKHHARRDR